MTEDRARGKYQVELVDFDYYRKQIPCQTACPVHTDARGYVNAVIEGDYQGGYVRAREPNPFASTCGRVCAAHCEKACRRGKIDAPIAIRALKRFVCEPYGVEAKSHVPPARGKGKVGMALLPEESPLNAATIQSFTQLSVDRARAGRRGTRTGIPVAVIGAGPAGLSAAHDLAILGHKPTIFEAAPYPGGMTLLGVPEYRLPRDLLKLEIGEILDLGVELKLNSRLGQDFLLGDLRKQGFQAVFIAIGAHKDRGMEIEGVQLDGVIAAVDFLLNINLGYRVRLGDKVVVVGGGDVAVDAARLAARLGEVYEQLATGSLVTAVDVARGVLRLGVRDVHMVYRGAREEMRASEEELTGALEEGIALHTALTPKRIVGGNGKVAGLEVVATKSVYDEKGRRSLVPVPGSETVLECSSIIMAVGQQSDLSFVRPEDGIETTRQNTIRADTETLATTAPGVFAGGDVVFGPRTIIEAVADGHKAARAMHNYLSKGRAGMVRKGWLMEVPLSYLPRTQYIEAPRTNPAKISLDRRTGISEVETVFDSRSAYEQAHRCLKCHIQTVFDSDRCILCGGCVDICPRDCLKLVPVEELEGSDDMQAVVRGRYGTELKAFREARNKGLPSRATAMIKDETKCIRCGLCYRRCPTSAITMEAFWFEEKLVEE
ncbi:MAG: FAD-dependent oxidoreductase [Chloroflexi bacterium]|nr:FAD-dependent oxidoreductase [Chloroflexota bacterium]